jgi:hypothetical protein
MVKLHIGAQIDGFAAISAETIVVGATPEAPVTGRRADVLKAAWHAAEIAMRTIKVGNKNWAVTEVVGKVASAWDCKPVEGMLRGAPRPPCRLLNCLCYRDAVVPADAERHRRQEAYHPQPERGTEARL